MDLEKLIDMICNATYVRKSVLDNSVDTYKVCYEKDEKRAITQAVYEWASGQLTSIEQSKHIGELEAKVYTYEAIIRNSNFAPLLIKAEEGGGTDDI